MLVVMDSVWEDVWLDLHGGTMYLVCLHKAQKGIWLNYTRTNRQIISGSALAIYLVQNNFLLSDLKKKFDGLQCTVAYV